MSRQPSPLSALLLLLFSIVPSLLLLSVVPSLLLLPSSVVADGRPGDNCSAASDCQEHLMCAMSGGRTCCMNHQCFPNCTENQVCLRNDTHCGDAGASCDCQPTFICYTPSPLPLTKPPEECRPPCEGDNICLQHGQVAGQYDCVKPFPGCWTWDDCTISGEKNTEGDDGKPGTEEEEKE